MKFSIERNGLLDSLQRIHSVIEKKNTVQILSNILCQVKDNVLSLSATDLEVGMKINLPVEMKEEGRITLSAKHFLDIVKELPEKTIDINRKDNNWVELVCGKKRSNVVSLSADEYPALPSFEEKTYLDTKAAVLRDMIDRTIFAIATDNTRYLLNGVFLENTENSMMRMTGTDGHRLSFVDNEVFIKMPDLKRGIIIPRKGLGELRKLIDCDNETIGLAFERGYIFSKIDNKYMFVRLIEGEYPDYRQVIPKSTDKVMTVKREIITSALKFVVTMSNEKSRGVRINLQGNTLSISSSNPDLGEAHDEIEINYSGDPVEIGFNAKYLLECLSVMKGEELEFHFKDKLSPGILRECGQRSHTYVIMPMRI
ncbi:MAG: DNA polymerase III subunit beta [Bdellovibrionales bacterium RIFOXYD1_FULL_53_11]|nr:MAG: DNA polymerase III subunit beta [Bdellovibrionales bacterium RIFOXYD1_FULL_53_11]